MCENLSSDFTGKVVGCVAGKLTPRQLRFVDEYLIDLNATQAAIRAGYKASTADVNGPRLLGNAGVAAAIQAGKARRARRTEVSQDDVIRELKAVAFKPASDEPCSELKYASKLRALELLGKHTGAFDKPTERADTTVRVIVDV